MGLVALLFATTTTAHSGRTTILGGGGDSSPTAAAAPPKDDGDGETTEKEAATAVDDGDGATSGEPIGSSSRLSPSTTTTTAAFRRSARYCLAALLFVASVFIVPGYLDGVVGERDDERGGGGEALLLLQRQERRIRQLESELLLRRTAEEAEAETLGEGTGHEKERRRRSATADADGNDGNDDDDGGGGSDGAAEVRLRHVEHELRAASSERDELRSRLEVVRDELEAARRRDRARTDCGDNMVAAATARELLEARNILDRTRRERELRANDALALSSAVQSAERELREVRAELSRAEDRIRQLEAEASAEKKAGYCDGAAEARAGGVLTRFREAGYDTANAGRDVVAGAESLFRRARRRLFPRQQREQRNTYPVW